MPPSHRQFDRVHFYFCFCFCSCIGRPHFVFFTSATRLHTDRYHPRYWWFDVLNLAKRLVLTSFALVFNRLSDMTVFVLLLSILALVIGKECEPYERQWMNAFSYVMSWQVVFFMVS